MTDYPSPLPQVNQTAPVPRRIRAAGQALADFPAAGKLPAGGDAYLSGWRGVRGVP